MPLWLRAMANGRSGQALTTHLLLEGLKLRVFLSDIGSVPLRRDGLTDYRDKNARFVT